MQPRLIDSHCHLLYDYSPKTVENLIQEAHSAGVETLINVGVEAHQIDELEKLSISHPNIYHTVGVHPHEAKLLKDSDIESFRIASKNPRCLAIGEIGLDYFYKHSEPNEQIRAIESQLDLALSVNLPVVIHGRDAEEDSLRILSNYCKKLPSSAIPGVLHCFTGTQEFGLKCIDLGFYISFSGILTFKSAEPIQDCAKIFPLNRILVETDSPYLAPIPFRGKKCEPSMVKQTAIKLAELRGIPFEEVAAATYSNTIKAFGIKDGVNV